MNAKKAIIEACPQVWACLNYKGGVGKSMISAHLASHLGAVLVDLDVQGDASRYAGRAKMEFHRAHLSSTNELFDLVDDLKAQGKRIVIDGPPGDNPLTGLAILVSDAVVAPTRPGENDLESLGRIAQAMKEANGIRIDQGVPRVPLFLLLNFYRRSGLADTFVDTLQSMGAGRYIGKLWERMDYSDALTEGMPVWNLAPGTPAAQEMKNLVEFLERTARMKEPERKKVSNG